MLTMKWVKWFSWTREERRSMAALGSQDPKNLAAENYDKDVAAILSLLERFKPDGCAVLPISCEVKIMRGALELSGWLTRARAIDTAIGHAITDAQENGRMYLSLHTADPSSKGTEPEKTYASWKHPGSQRHGKGE
jgi:hypothetical protein